MQESESAFDLLLPDVIVILTVPGAKIEYLIESRITPAALSHPGITVCNQGSHCHSVRAIAADWFRLGES